MLPRVSTSVTAPATPTRASTAPLAAEDEAAPGRPRPHEAHRHRPAGRRRRSCSSSTRVARGRRTRGSATCGPPPRRPWSARIADWFAVTALFRHPLGIPIPHTAIIPNRKDDIGRGLGTFVQQNFLTRARRRGAPRAASSLAARLGAWLAEPANAERVGDQVGGVLRSTLDDAAGRGGAGRPRGGRRRAGAGDRGRADPRPGPRPGHRRRPPPGAPVGPAPQGRRGGRRDNEDVAAGAARSSETPWWVPDRVDDRIFDRVHTGVRRFLAGGGRRPRPRAAGHTSTSACTHLADELGPLARRCGPGPRSSRRS